MRAQRKGSVFIVCILFAFGIGTGTSNVFAQGSGAAGASDVENLKKQMAQMEEQLRQLRLQVEKLSGQSTASQPAGPSAASAADPALQKDLPLPIQSCHLACH
jgi:TolA-binding protein